MVSLTERIGLAALAVLATGLPACHPDLPDTMYERPVLRARIEVRPSNLPGCAAEAVAINETPQHWVRVHHDMRERTDGGARCRVDERIRIGHVDVGAAENDPNAVLGCTREVRSDGCTVTRDWQINSLTFSPLLSEADAIG